jgi:hypothetical protein
MSLGLWRTNLAENFDGKLTDGPFVTVRETNRFLNARVRRRAEKSLNLSPRSMPGNDDKTQTRVIK